MVGRQWLADLHIRAKDIQPKMLAKKVLSKCPGKRCRLGFVTEAAPFSSQASDGGPAEPATPLRHQSRNFSSGAAGSAPRQPATAPAAPGTDYISLFQPASERNALSRTGPYTPGHVLKIYPLPRYVLKEDIIRHLEVNKLQSENVKLVYNAVFRPEYVQFDVDSAATQRQIMKRLQERGRLGCKVLKAELVAPVHWTVVDAALKDSPRGKTVLMYNLNMSTDFEDVERFFSGYNIDAKHIRFVRLSNEQVAERIVKRRTVLHVAVGFTTRLEALRAVREKTGDFCANVAVNLRLIQ